MWLISCIGHKGRIKRRRRRGPIPYQRINSIDDGRSLLSTRSGASSRRNTPQSITVCLALVRAPYLDICPSRTFVPVTRNDCTGIVNEENDNYTLLLLRHTANIFLGNRRPAKLSQSTDCLFYVRYQPVVNVRIWSCIELVFRLQLGLLELEFELLGLCADYG